jgi:hypothetical protein
LVSFNSLYLSLNTDHVEALKSTSFFLLRRLALAASLLLLLNSQFFQVLSTSLISMALLTYQLTVKPMKERLFNILDVFNEFTFLMTTCMLLGFTEYTPKEGERKEVQKETRELYGWVFIGIVSFYILVNMFYIIKGIYDGLKLKIKPLIDKKCSKKAPKIDEKKVINEKEQMPFEKEQ